MNPLREPGAPDSSNSRPPDHMVREVEDDTYCGWCKAVCNVSIYLDLIENIISGIVNQKSSLEYIGFIFLFDFLKYVGMFMQPVGCNKPGAPLEYLMYREYHLCIDKTKMRDQVTYNIFYPFMFAVEIGQAFAFSSLAGNSPASLVIFVSLALIQFGLFYFDSVKTFNESMNHPPWIVIRYMNNGRTSFLYTAFPFDILALIIAATGDVPFWYDVIIAYTMWSVTVRPRTFLPSSIYFDRRILNDATFDKIELKLLEKGYLMLNEGFHTFPESSKKDKHYSDLIRFVFLIFIVGTIVYVSIYKGVTAALCGISLAIIIPYGLYCETKTKRYYKDGFGEAFEEAYRSVVAEGVELNDEGNWCAPTNIDVSILVANEIKKLNPILSANVDKTMDIVVAQRDKLDGTYTCNCVLAHSTLEDLNNVLRNEYLVKNGYQTKQRCGHLIDQQMLHPSEVMQCVSCARKTKEKKEKKSSWPV